AAALARGIEPRRVSVVRGDLRVSGLGLDGPTRARLLNGVDVVLHAAADTAFSQPLPAARAINVAGTRRLLELADGRDTRFVLVSTAFVAGRRTGLILEDDAPEGHGWVNAYERSKHEAEALVRAYARTWLILRPSTLVCDSVSGRVRQRNAVHRLLGLCRAGLTAMLPGGPDTPVDVVPDDYVAAAVATLALREDVAGRTLHLCSGARAPVLGPLLERSWAFWRCASPAWARRAIELPALVDVDTYRLLETTVRESGDRRLARVMHALSHFAPQLALPKHFDTTGADALLGFAAPDPDRYWDLMLEGLGTGRASARRAA
ncbi:MAG: SDR family oxidoreductase, partial [Longimicrobiales bacterium]